MMKFPFLFPLFTITAILAIALSSSSAVTAAAQGTDEMMETYTVEWDDSGLLLMGRKIVLETIAQAASSSSQPSSSVMDDDAEGIEDGEDENDTRFFQRILRRRQAKTSKGAATAATDCAWAATQIRDGVAAFKSGELDGVRRYLAMFHEDARVNMLAGFLHDGHDIRGKDHLTRSLGFGAMSPNPNDTSEHPFLKAPAPFPHKITRFEDFDYAATKSTEANGVEVCVVYLSLTIEFTPLSGDDDEPVTTEGLARYDVTMDGHVVSKLSLNVHHGDDSSCDVDRTIDEQYGVRQ